MGAYGAYSLGGSNAANVTGVHIDAGLLGPATGALFVAVRELIVWG